MTTLYTATDEGVLVSHNGQTGFAQLAHGLQGKRVVSVAGFATRPDVAFAAVPGEGVHRTEDAGETWMLCHEGDAQALAVRGGEQPIIVAGLAPAEVAFSSDNGRTWRTTAGVAQALGAKAREDSVRICALALHPALPQSLWAAVEGAGILACADGGSSWKLRAEGLDPDVHDLLVHPSNPNLMLAATGEGPYRSEDGGRSWQPSAEGLQQRPYTVPLAFLRGEPELVYTAGARGEPGSWVGMYGAEALVFRSRDFGASWERVDPEQEHGLPASFVGMVSCMAGHPTWADVLYFGVTSGVVYATADRGQGWRRIMADLPPVNALSVGGL